ncbi:hypothetical protein V493_02209 [Pseudogymnoascus sp. VKM F-4281 (FW-2241)]|nr:hypothetical protein V493_02209 [Pseudogymnoascus sp. VKM F-4281 (FW-2241)]
MSPREYVLYASLDFQQNLRSRLKPGFENKPLCNTQGSGIYLVGIALGARMASQEAADEPLSTYRGKRQPPVNERLQQIYNFLADEDIYRCLNFTERFRDICDYINDLETGKQIFVQLDEELLSLIFDQIKIHEHWIKEATEITPFEFNSPLLRHKNRFNLPGWEPKPGLISFELEDLPKYEMDTTPIPEAKLHVTFQEDTGRKPPKDPDPFEYTKKLAWYREMQDVKAQTLRERYDSREALAFNPLPRNFKGPWAPPTAVALLLKWEEERQKLMGLSQDLISTNKRAPRLTLAQVVHMINTIFAYDTPAETMLMASDFTSTDLTKLLVLTKRSTHRTKPSNFRGQYLTFVARVNGIIRSTDTWPEEVEKPVKVEDLIDMVKSKGRINLDLDEMIWTLEIMHEDGNLRYDKIEHEIRAPYPNNHPEDRGTLTTKQFQHNPLGVTLSEWAYFGMRLANAIMKLSTQLEMAYSDEGYMERVMTEYTNNLAKRIRAWEKEVDSSPGVPSLIELATPLVKDAHKVELTEEVAIKNLQEKIVEESNRNWEPRATPTTIWNWTRKRKLLTEECFSIDRWTPAIQHSGDLEKENMYWDWFYGRTPDDLPAGPKRRKLIKGEPSLPIGETVVQEEAISDRIDEHLRNLGNKEFEGVYGPQGSHTLKRKALREAEAKAKAQAKTPTSKTGPQGPTP